MSELLAAAVAFAVTHYISATPLRGIMVRGMGEKLYRAIYSIVALITFVWMCRAYGRAEYVWLWDFGAWTMYVTHVLVLLGFLFVVGGIGVRNPMAMNMADRVVEPPYGWVRITRHPLFWGIALWAAGHLLVNGDEASLIFFGTFIFVGLGGTLPQEARKEVRCGEAWGDFAATTSNIPFLAIVQGRQQLSLKEIGLLRPVIAVILYALMFYYHPDLFSISPLMK